MRVRIGGNVVILDPQDALGDGGEANVIRYGDVAVKVYHKPTPAHEAKVNAFIQEIRPKLPVSVISPLEPVYSDRGNKVVGFTMRCLDAGYDVLSLLSKRNFRTSHAVGPRGVASVFMSGHRTLSAIHKAGAVVGDLNDLNELFSNADDMVWIDADSFQIPGHPCYVATETFLDPRLYGPDLSSPVTTKDGKPRLFRPENDWYSFAVLLFRSLTLVHPYGGVDASLPTIPRRANAKRSVFASSVKYPSKVAYSLEVMSDDLIETMRAIFDAGERPVFPYTALEAYRNSLTTCKKCNSEYPKERKRCPSCAAVTPPPPVITAKTDVTVESVLHDPVGDVLALYAAGDVLFAASKNALNCVRGPRAWRESLLNVSPKHAIRLSQRLLAHVDAHSGQVIVIDAPSTSSPKPYYVTTEDFAGQPVFGVSPNRYYRLASGMLMRGEPGGGEEVLTSVMRNQTWFRVATHTDENGADIVLGCSRVFGQRRFFVMIGKRRFDVDPAIFDGGGTVIDETVVFSTRTIAVLQRLLDNGVEMVRTVFLGHCGGKLASYTQKVSERLAGSAIRGGVLRGNSLLIATERGIVREKFDEFNDGTPVEQKLFSATEPFVSHESLLVPFGNGIAVAHGGYIRLLKMS